MSAKAKKLPTVDVITMGCSKNLVDSERVMKQLADVGYDVVHEPGNTGRGDIVIINTCGFIGDAKEESINEILRHAADLKAGRIKELRVMGCLSQRYGKELKAEIPEVTAWYGKNDWHRLISDLAKARPATAPYDRIITTPGHHAYVKIAEGCDRFCAFCAIPLITGRFHSRPIDEIIAETRMLVGRGVKEFNVIAQDLSSYGRDIPGNGGLARLIDRMAGIEGVEWIRLHYAYPADFPLDVLDVMVQHDNVCKYLDIALQHIADPVLVAMRRHIDGDMTRRLIATMREKVPGLHLRTTLMTGFPGEGEAEFEALMDFVKETRFERMGAFAYCEEEGTYAALNLPDTIADEIKQQRLDRLMSLQEEISLEIQQAKIGTVQKIIIDRREGDFMVGRTQWDSPEVDPEVLVPIGDGQAELCRGQFYNVKITGASPFELIATVNI